MENKNYLNLIKYLKELDSVLVAFSGGVDSTFLLKAAKDALNDKAAAITIACPYIPKWEIEEAKKLAKIIGIRHELIEVADIIEEIRFNPKDRCYLCKKTVFSLIKDYADKNNYKYVADGTNADDINDYRPGIRALKELSIKSPLLENGFTKSDIRNLSKELSLQTWDKPSYACLLSRIPYGAELKISDFSKIELSEKYLMDKGYRAVRVRAHGDLARIEVPRENLESLFNLDLLDEISSKLEEFGFKYVTLDIKGYRTGSLNIELESGI
ncbi:MAG: ATP-dependent sacrificial sulfur transferase LarE [Solirubrobacterales bacterium]